MKKIPILDPNAAFPEKSRTPNDDDLRVALGDAFAPIAELLHELSKSCPQATAAWQYSGQSGWYRLALLKKRRLFYLVPQRGDFRLMFILGGKAISALRAAPDAREFEQLLKTATRYPEGTAFRFDRASCKPKVIAALLTAKLAHQAAILPVESHELSVQSRNEKPEVIQSHGEHRDSANPRGG